MTYFVQLVEIQGEMRLCNKARVLIVILILQRINQKVGDRSARDRSKRPRFYAALFVSFT